MKIDSIENRVVKAALIELLDSHSDALLEEHRAAFRTLLNNLGAVTFLPEIKRAPLPIPNPKSEYANLLPLCEIVLWGYSATNAHKIARLPIPIVKDDYLFFEELVRQAVKRVVPRSKKGHVKVSSEDGISFNPDLVVPIDGKETPIVIDMKYKMLEVKEHGKNNKSDLYQVISHSHAYADSPYLGLVYPSFTARSVGSQTIVFDLLEHPMSVTAFWVDQQELLDFVTSTNPDPRTWLKILTWLELAASEPSGKTAINKAA